MPNNSNGLKRFFRLGMILKYDIASVDRWFSTILSIEPCKKLLVTAICPEKGFLRVGFCALGGFLVMK